MRKIYLLVALLALACFAGAANIYINNQDCYFNANYNTDTHIIMTIPSDLIVYGQDNTLPMEIRVETTHGTAVYAFHVIAGVPTIDFYKADMEENEQGIPEIQPGQIMELHGSLFHEIQSIYVAGLDTMKLADCPSWEVNDSCTVAYVKMPNVIPANGIMVMECFSGTAYCGFSKSPMKPELYDISSDMPIPGQTITLFGKYLADLTSINIGGEIDIDINTVTVSAEMDKVTFTMPDKLPSTAANGTIRLKTLGGVAELPFYRYDWILEDFDGNGTNNVQFNGKQAPKGIDASTPLSDLELRYEVYLPEIPSATCYSKITFMGAEVDKIAIADRITGQATAGEWTSVAIPLTQFGTGTYGDLVGSAPGDDGNFKIYHSYDEIGIWFSIVYDNFRIYQIK